MTDKPTVLDAVEDPSVTDPLSEVTRKERKALLAACIVGLAISAGGLVPERIETFGITVTPRQEESLLYILAGVIGYFLLAFAIYAWSDLKRRDTVAAKHRQRLRPVIEEASARFKRSQERLKKHKVEAMSESLQDSDFLELAGMSDQMKFAQRVQRVGTLRVLVDVHFPLLAGITAMVVVWSSTGGFPGWSDVGVGTLAAGVVSGGVVLWWRRREVYRWWRKRRRDRRSQRQKKLMKQAQALPADDPRKAQLLQEARDLLMKTLDDMRDGVL